MLQQAPRPSGLPSSRLYHNNSFRVLHIPQSNSLRLSLRSRCVQETHTHTHPPLGILHATSITIAKHAKMFNKVALLGLVAAVSANSPPAYDGAPAYGDSPSTSSTPSAPAYTLL